MISYISTRGNAKPLNFAEVVLAGLAEDGGLYVPDRLPLFKPQELKQMAALSYAELAIKVLTPFTEGAIPAPVLENIIRESYATFDHPEVTPLKKFGENRYLLELFHGPTLAFKDVALQFLGRMLEYLLEKEDKTALVIGATSGDTGSAAIAGCRGKKNMRIVILHPHNRTSEVQRRQMTTVEDANVHNIAIEGSFDDCQALVKALFSDAEFRARHRPIAVNSINWARILAQTVYYFYASLRLPAAPVFSVPTGNFGDIFAGYLAHEMGVPVSKLIIATNRNDILHRTLKTGTYKIEGVTPSLSPSMDIQISSNFERLLYDMAGSEELCGWMEGLKKQGQFTLDEDSLDQIRDLFESCSVNDEETKQAIAQTFKNTGTLIDPHTAVGVKAAQKLKTGAPIVTLATAHPAKFPEVVKEATGNTPELPKRFKDLFAKKERFNVLPNDLSKLRSAIENL